MAPFLDERGRRLFTASEARAAGRGGVTAVATATRVARSTIGRGLAELRLGRDALGSRIRRPGGGRKPAVETQPGLLEALGELVQSAIRGDPEAAFQVDEAGVAVDGHVEVPVAALAVAGAQLGQVLHVHVHEAQIICLEAAVRSAGAISRRQAAQALGFQDAVDRIAIEMGQKVGGHKSEIHPKKSRLHAAERRRCPALLPLLSRGACAGGWSPGSRLGRACGSSRSRRYTAWPAPLSAQ